MLEPIVHIGYPKTASSWFQRQFLPFVENITIIPENEIFKYFFDDEKFIPDYNTIRNHFNLYSGKLILSNHGFVGTNHSFGMKNYLTRGNAYRLQNIFPDAKIILFIRNQVDIIASAYIEYIKAGGTYSISKYLNPQRFRNLNDLIFFYYSYFEYHLLIEFYEKLFSKENVFIYLFEDFNSEPKGFIKDLAKTFSLEYKLEDIDFNKFNPRYRKGIIPLLRLSNRFTEKKVVNKNYCIHIPACFEYSRKVFKWSNQWKIFGNTPSSEFVLGKKNLDYIHSYYKESNRILVNKYKLNNILKYDYPL